MLRHSLLWLSSNPQVRGFAVHSSVGRQMARRFVAGECLADAVAVVRELNVHGLSASLDHLGENVSSADQARQATQDYIDILHRIKQEGLNANISVKLTQLGLGLDGDGVQDNLLRILAEADALGDTVTVDMEGSAYTERTVRLVLAARRQHANVGVAIQSYLYRSQADLDELVRAKVCGIRLCKGAYDEPPTIAFPHKQDVDQNYRQLTRFLLGSGCHPALATHDVRLIEFALQNVQDLGLGPGDFEFQMLYGIRRDLQERLVSGGWALRVYVPYGSEWYPYLMRRLAERPANLLFFARSLASEIVPNHRGA
ncbi:MAG: proline dehydrogenase [Chloroflexota bacterium]|nr:MAG: proline dehydrogenase [Chloroflexota bacterium]